MNDNNYKIIKSFVIHFYNFHSTKKTTELDITNEKIQ